MFHGVHTAAKEIRAGPGVITYEEILRIEGSANRSVPRFFMKILTSSGTRFPFESVPTVNSRALMVCRVASVTMSEYSDEIVAAAVVIFWSRATERLCASA